MNRLKPHARRQNRQADVGRFLLLLVILVITIGLLGIVGIPRYADNPSLLLRILVTLLSAGILFATIRVTDTTERHQRWYAYGIGAVAVAAILSFYLADTSLMSRTIGILWVLLVLATPVLVLKGVLAAKRVTAQTILGAIGVYLLLGIALTFIAMAMDGWGGFFATTPRSTAFVYFAFVTVTTLGYGDLVPYTDAARMVSVAAAVVAQMYLVVVVARLVSVWGPRRESLAEETTE